MVTSWLLAEYVQPSLNENVVLHSCYEYQGKLWLIFSRYVLRDPGGSAPEDRDWFFDQYVVDKNTGVLLHTQLDCGLVCGSSILRLNTTAACWYCVGDDPGISSTVSTRATK